MPSEVIPEVRRRSQAERDQRIREIESEISTVVRNPDAYRRAADLIRAQGFIRDTFAATAPAEQGGKPCNIEDPSAGCFCIMGALTRAGIDLDLLHPQSKGYAWDPTWTDGPDYGFAMIPEATRVMNLPRSANTWNNRDARSTDEVIAALEGGAVYLETMRYLDRATTKEARA